jgi:hypothetical protein
MTAKDIFNEQPAITAYEISKHWIMLFMICAMRAPGMTGVCLPVEVSIACKVYCPTERNDANQMHSTCPSLFGKAVPHVKPLNDKVDDIRHPGRLAAGICECGPCTYGEPDVASSLQYFMSSIDEQNKNNSKDRRTIHRIGRFHYRFVGLYYCQSDHGFNVLEIAERKNCIY